MLASKRINTLACQLPVLPALDKGNPRRTTDFQQPPRLGMREIEGGCHPHKTQFQVPDGARTTEIASSTAGILFSCFVEITLDTAAALACLAWISS